MATYTGNTALIINHPVFASGDTLEHYYPLDEVSGYGAFDNAFNPSATRQDGTWVGNGQWDYTTPGVLQLNMGDSSCMKLDGSSYIDFGGFAPTSKTISMWVRHDGPSGSNFTTPNAIVMCGSNVDSANASDTVWAFYISNGAFKIWHNGAVLYTDSSITIYDFNNYVLIRDDGNGHSHVYKNSTLVATGTADTTAAPMTWGKGGTQYWSGNLDDIRFYKIPINQDQINQINNGVNLHVANTWAIPNPVGSSAVTLNHPTFTSSAHSSVGTYTGNMSKSVSKTFFASGTMPPSRTGQAGVLSVSKTFLAGAIFTKPVYTGQATVSTSKSFIAAGDTIPHFQGSAVLGRHPAIVTAGTATIPAYHGSCTKTLSHSTFGAIGGDLIPVYTAATTQALIAKVLFGATTFFGWTSNMTLAITGHMKLDQPLMTLIIQPPYQMTTDGSGPGFMPLPLYIIGPRQASNAGFPVRMSVTGAVFQPFLPCSTWEEIVYDYSTDKWIDLGPCPDPRKVPLYLEAGGTPSKSLNLSVARDPAPIVTNQVEMSIRGHLNWPTIGISNPMFIQGWDNPGYKSMNLWIEGGSGTDGRSSVINLSVVGGYPTSAGYAPLCVFNQYGAKARSANLFVKGDGTTPGFVPINSDMNLHLERGNTGGITLVMANNEGGQSIPLFIMAAPSISQSAPLFLQVFGDKQTNSVSLAIPNVTAPQQITNQTTLAIPGVFGLQPDNMQPLYINGFIPIDM